jgi:hypothetical protein
MNKQPQRMRAIELTLTPQQVVLVWLRNALQAGTFEEGARHTPPYRGTVANAVYGIVRNSMKGHAEPLIERAVIQARQEADLLYNLVVHANVKAFENGEQREREYLLLLGYLSAQMHGKATKDRIQTLRLVVLRFLESVIILDTAIAQIVAERLNGQPVLFRDCSAKLEEQVQMAERASEYFNRLARSAGTAEINLGELRKSLQPETDRQISIWVSLARLETLSSFGNLEDMHAAMDRLFLLLKPKSDEDNNAADA